jgi:dTDP-4-dehydrorhamnose reductase
MTPTRRTPLPSPRAVAHKTFAFRIPPSALRLPPSHCYNVRVITRALEPVPLPLLITGVAGVAGYNAFNYFRARYPGQVIAIRQEDNWPLTGDGVIACNAEDHPRLRALFDDYQFQSVLNCAGNCALRACELDSRLAWRTNVEGLINLLSIIVDREVRLVHLSIDLVYSGKRHSTNAPSPFPPPPYTESDPTDPVTVYGKTMVAAEQLLADWMPDACTLRISLPMGVSFNGHAGAIDWIQSRFKKGRPATLYFDEVRTPAYTDCLNRLYERVLASDLAGIYHAGGPRALSLYQIAQIVNRVGGYDPKLLMGCPRIEAGPIPPRAGDVSMNSTALIEALDDNPLDAWPFDTAFVPTHPDWHHERNGTAGSRDLLARILYRNPRLVDAC